MIKEIQKELEEVRSKIPPDLFLKLIQELYFQTSWELIKYLIEYEDIDPNIIFKHQLEICKKTGKQGANLLKIFQFSGNSLEKLVKQFAFAAYNMGIKAEIKFKSEEECELTFKKNCGHGLKIKEYNLPFKCNTWCETHFNSEIKSLNSQFAIKLIEGLPQNKKYCRFLIYKTK
ncbi:MAG: hypothetical protein ACTSQO_04520 [Candidatus Helarchaeota archaeon]